MTTRSKVLKGAKRIVVKVGTTTITHASGKTNFAQIDRIARELSDLVSQGYEIILVTSGAIAVGVDKMGLGEKPKLVPEKQAAAAVGQAILMQNYEKVFAEYSQNVGQVLLTRSDAVVRNRYTNCRNTLLALLKHKIIPIVNENDAISIDEIKIGDNDNLSAVVAGIVDADLVIILSDVDGLYTANPQTDPKAKLVSEVTDITPQIKASAGGAGSKSGTGGMMTKIQAAITAVTSGINLVICSGQQKEAFAKILAGEEIGTLFVSKENRLQFRKRWLAFGARIKGSIEVDAGCAKAIHGKGACSILPAGVTKISGKFDVGDTVSVLDTTGREIARGLINYSAVDSDKIKGVKTSEIENILGHKHYDELIHRDDLVVL